MLFSCNLTLSKHSRPILEIQHMCALWDKVLFTFPLQHLRTFLVLLLPGYFCTLLFDSHSLFLSCFPREQIVFNSFACSFSTCAHFGTQATFSILTVAFVGNSNACPADMFWFTFWLSFLCLWALQITVLHSEKCTHSTNFADFYQLCFFTFWLDFSDDSCAAIFLSSITTRTFFFSTI